MQPSDQEIGRKRAVEVAAGGALRGSNGEGRALRFLELAMPKLIAGGSAGARLYSQLDTSAHSAASPHDIEHHRLELEPAGPEAQLEGSEPKPQREPEPEPSEWSCEQVVAHLQELRVTKATAERFVEHNIQGAAFVGLSRADIEERLGIAAVRPPRCSPRPPLPAPADSDLLARAWRSSGTWR